MTVDLRPERAEPAHAEGAAAPRPVGPSATPGATDERRVKLAIRDLNVYYGAFRALRDITLDVHANAVTAIIGPSGSGKSTLLRSINRMTDLVPSARATGEVMLDGANVLDEQVDVVEVRPRVSTDDAEAAVGAVDAVRTASRLRAVDEEVEQAGLVWRRLRPRSRRNEIEERAPQLRNTCAGRSR